MLFQGKFNVLGVLVDAVDYDGAVERVMLAATETRGFAVSALAVHGVMTGVMDPEHRHRLNSLDMVTPDGQPVRWALNLLHGLHLSERVYGPSLTLEICAAAAERGIPVFFYGSRKEVLELLVKRLQARFPDLDIAGTEPSKFRTTTPEERDEMVIRIKRSGAKITFVGLGCPRQEVFAYEYREALGMPVIAVGAAFDFHAGLLKQAPPELQKIGLEWLFRLFEEPGRLWWRYALLNPAFLVRLALQHSGLWRPDPANTIRPSREVLYG
jgi:N-acetylglucosaminyldiphosphoundecaprenol N-acetyl-beta-D-mannosaminyltransferase